MVLVAAFLTLQISIQAVAAESTVSTDVPYTATAYNNARRLVRDSNGYLYAAYYAGLATSGVHIARSTDNGASWNSAWAHIDSIGESPSLAIDSQDNLHCVWVKHSGSPPTTRIHYKKYTYATETWDTLPTHLSEGLIPDNRLPAVAVDSSDTIHVVWEWFQGPCVFHRIYYAKYEEGSGWTSQQISDGAHASSAPSIALDGDNNIYVAYGGDPTAMGPIYLAKYTWTPFSWVETTVSPTGRYPCIAVDSNNNPHIVYTDNNRVQYRRYSGGSWSPPIALDDGLHICHAPSISFTPNGDVYVLWHNNVVEHQIWLHRSTDNGATWPSENRAQLATGIYPSLRWSFYNNPDAGTSAEWIYTAPVASYAVNYDSKRIAAVGGEIIPANILALLAPWIALGLAAIAVGSIALARMKRLFY